MAKPTRAEPQTKFVDNPELSETFADSIEEMMFDGVTMRITFTVTRLEEPRPPALPKGKRYPSCRLILTGDAVEDLHRRLNQIATVIEQGRKAREARPGPTTIQ